MEDEYIKKYKKNFEVAKKIGKKLGFRILGLNPDWYIKRTIDLGERDKNLLLVACDQMTGKGAIIPDWLMGKLARLFKLPWVYEMSTPKLKSFLKKEKENLKWAEKIKNMMKKDLPKSKEFYEEHNKSMDIIKGSITTAEIELMERGD